MHTTNLHYWHGTNPMLPTTSGFYLGRTRRVTSEEAAQLLANIDPEDGEWWYYTPTGQLRRAKYGQPQLDAGVAVGEAIQRLKNQMVRLCT